MLIKNGVLVTASDVFKSDIFIEDGVIKEIGLNLNKDCETIDACGNYIIPGGVDVHTHFDLDLGNVIATDNFLTGTIAAACGGTTTVVDHMGFGPDMCKLSHQVNKYHTLADGKAVIDYSFHGVIQHVNKDILDEMETLIQEGITSYKIYLTYNHKLDDAEAFQIIERIKELGLILTVHPENDGATNYLRAKFIEEGKLSPIYHEKSRPVEVEAEAINRMINLCAIAGDAPLYIVHLSNGLGLQYLNMAKKRGQKNLFVETCPQYLFLNDEYYLREDALKFIISPPLRNKINNKALWDGIALSQIDTIATDHCPFNYKKEKQLGKDDFTKCPGGAPGVETRIPLMFSEVMKQNLSINKFVELCSTNPAKLFGLYPKKGTIAIGTDADLVIIDPNKKVTLSKSMLHENVDYTPYEGIQLLGYPIMTISRGEIIVKDNVFLGKAGRGEYIKRTKPCYV